MRLIYHPEAEAELIDAALFYEKRVTSLGAQFLAATDQAVERILANPESFRVIATSVGVCGMKRFPYSIYFRVEVDTIRVLAIKHHSRHPDYWQHRSD